MCHVDRVGNVVEECERLKGWQSTHDRILENLAYSNKTPDEFHAILSPYIYLMEKHFKESWAITVKNEPSIKDKVT